MNQPLAPVAQVAGVSLQYGKTRALDDLSVDLPARCMVGLIGPDGVGKSSLLALIAGARKLQQGRVRVLDGDMGDAGHRRAVCPRIAYMPQGLGKNLYPTLTVFENLELAQKTDKSVWASLRARLSGEQKDRIDEVLETIRLGQSRHRPAGLLSHGQKQFLEIGMLLMQSPQLLLLDEPVAGMTDAETEFTAELFKSLAREHSLMVVEHDMGFVETIADHVTVLHQGQVLAEGSLQQVQADERVIEVYLGR